MVILGATIRLTVAAALVLSPTVPASAQSVLSAAPPEVTADESGRIAIGRGEDYAPSTEDPLLLADRLAVSMQDRREFAWQVVEKMLLPQHVTLLDGVTTVDVPLWQTWYEGAFTPNAELDTVIQLYLSKLKRALDENPNADFEPIIKETIAEYSTKDLTDTLTDDNLAQPLLQFRDVDMPGLSDRLGRGFTVFSPAFVEHVLREAQGIDECDRSASAADDPPSDDQFSPCIDEFPRSAVMVKTSWEELKTGVAEHDTTAAGLTNMFELGTWPSPPVLNPTQTQIYTNVTKEGTAWGLKGIHFVTKDVREWVWVSLWWDPNAKTEDFGSDQPETLANYNHGVWANYKMCVTSAFAEKDAEPWTSFNGSRPELGASIKAVYDAIQKQIDSGASSDATALGTLFRPPFTPPAPVPLEIAGALGPWPTPHNQQTSWCSNPNIETHPGNGRTSCIGCHQFPVTRNEERNDEDTLFQNAILGDFPQFGRAQYRANFPAEFAWSFEFEFQPVIQFYRQQIGLNWPPS